MGFISSFTLASNSSTYLRDTFEILQYLPAPFPIFVELSLSSKPSKSANTPPYLYGTILHQIFVYVGRELLVGSPKAQYQPSKKRSFATLWPMIKSLQQPTDGQIIPLGPWLLAPENWRLLLLPWQLLIFLMSYYLFWDNFREFGVFKSTLYSTMARCATSLHYYLNMMQYNEQFEFWML